MNSKQDEILTILQEECAEVIQAVSKIKRFGLRHNRDNLKKEVADLLCMIDIALAHDVVEYGEDELEDLKYSKVVKLHQFSSIYEST